MHLQRYDFHSRILRAVVALVALMAGLAPLATRVNAQQRPAPPAVQFSLALQLQGPDDNFSINASGLANRSGDLQLLLSMSAPETHTLDLTIVDGTVYLSEDSGAWQVLSLKALSAGARGGVLPSSCLMAAVGTPRTDLPALLTSAGPLSSAVSARNEGQAEIDGIPTNHLAVHVDLAALLGRLAPLLQDAFAGCGLPNDAIAELNSPEARALLNGAALDADVYQENPDGFLRRLTINLNVPNAPLSIAAELDLTPLSEPQIIAPPVV